MEVDVLGIDLAKRVFQLHGVDRTGRALHRSKVSRGTLLKSITDLSPRLVVMEACSSAQHWARRLKALGIEAKLISPQYVTPFVKTNKNDRNDAEAIVEAASRPSMCFVSVKTVEQQDLQALRHQDRSARRRRAAGMLRHPRRDFACASDVRQDCCHSGAHGQIQQDRRRSAVAHAR